MIKEPLFESVAVGFFTHIATPEVIDSYQKLKEDLVDVGKTMIVAEVGTPIPEVLLNETCFFDFKQISLTAKVIGSEIVPGNCHLAMLAFFRKWPDFDYYWHVEYDVTFTGTWRTLLRAWNNNESDLIAPHLRSRSQEPDWPWWSSLQVPAVADRDIMRAFLPIYRISRRALQCLDSAVKEGCTGHFESLVPTVLQAASLRICDLGEGRFYTSSSSPTGDLYDGTLRYRPYHLGPLQNKDHLYHPVKPRAWIEIDQRRAAAQRAELRATKRALAAAARALAYEQRKNLDLLTSTSWRVTAPGRVIARYLLRLLAPRRSSHLPRGPRGSD